MGRLTDQLSKIKKEATSALEAGENSRAAKYEIHEEFPQNYIKMFKIFLDFGPFLYHDFFQNETFGEMKSHPIPPTILTRFLRSLVLSYGLSESSRPPETLERELTSYLSLLDKRRLQWSKPTDIDLDSFDDSKNLINEASQFRILLYQLAEFEFLGEDNWEFRVHPPEEVGKYTLISSDYYDYNPLNADRKLSKYTLNFLYKSDVETEYTNFRGLASFPPVDALVKVQVTGPDGNCTAADLQRRRGDIVQRLTHARQSIDAMSQGEIDRYFGHCYLLPYYLKQNQQWSTSDLPKQIKKTITEQKYSDHIYQDEELYVLRYFKGLRDGAEKLLNDLEA